MPNYSVEVYVSFDDELLIFDEPDAETAKQKAIEMVSNEIGLKWRLNYRIRAEAEFHSDGTPTTESV